MPASKVRERETVQIRTRIGDTVHIWWNRTLAIIENQAQLDCYNSHGDIWPIMLSDECLVRLEKPERLTVSKILWIPDSAKREAYELYQGFVLAAGPGKRRKDGKVNPNEVKAGDRCLFYWAAGEGEPVVRWTEDNTELRVIGEWQIQLRWPGHLSLVEAMR